MSQRSFLRTSCPSRSRPPALIADVAAPAAGGGSGGLLDAIAAEIQRHFQPECMRGLKLEDNGLCTFSMVQHECREICHDRHNNQVYAVADLKRRVYYAKCHADRTKKGPEHPFPPSLDALTLVDASELQPSGVPSTFTMAATSESAQSVLRFCRLAFGNSGVAARIPQPGTASILYKAHSNEYEIQLGPCDADGGQLLLGVTQSGVSIRCLGGTRCSRQGWRLERPSRSGQVRVWDLRFLLPQLPPPPLIFDDNNNDQEEEEEGGGVVARVGSSPAAAFLAQRNFFAALDFPLEGADPTLYDGRLSIIEEWAMQMQQQAPPSERSSHGVHVQAALVTRKASILRAILMNAEMESVYRECLLVDPDFAYPIGLVPKSPRVLVVALWVWLARTKGYKRVGDDFYVPTTTPDGARIYYTSVAMSQMMTRVFSFERMPNLCALMWSARNSGDMEQMLRDENHWPSLNAL